MLLFKTFTILHIFHACPPPPHPRGVRARVEENILNAMLKN